MRWAYLVNQVPGGANAQAWAPMITRPGLIATRGLVHVYGDPGLEEIYSPPPGLPTMSFDPRTNPSYNAPNGIWPDIYIAETRNMGPWATQGSMHTRWGDNEQPEPAVPVVPMSPRPVSRRARIGGRSVWSNPRVITRWRERVHG